MIVGSNSQAALSSMSFGRFMPLSQLFSDEEADDEKKVIYGRQEKPRKKKENKAQSESSEYGSHGPWDKPHKCKYCDEPAAYDLIWADGRAFLPVCREHRAKGEARIKKNKGPSGYGREKVVAVKKVAQEAITTTANVPTVPVPLGGGDGRKSLDRLGQKKKKKLPVRMTLLLKRLF